MFRVTFRISRKGGGAASATRSVFRRQEVAALIGFEPEGERADKSAEWPKWARLVGSIAIAGHFLAVATTVLSSQSGPWPGGDMAHAPMFAELLAAKLDPWLAIVKLSTNFHFNECRPTVAARFEAILRDSQGNEIKRLQFPDPNASSALRHKQSLLAFEIAQDEPLRPPQGFWVAAPGKEAKKVPGWIVNESGKEGKLGSIAENLIPRDRPTFGPTALAAIAAQSYARHLCRQHQVAKCEIVRYDRMLFPPLILMEAGEPNPSFFEENSRSFGAIDAEPAAN